MPNHVINELTFSGIDHAAYHSLCSFVCDQDGKADFSILVPKPLNLWLGNSGQLHEQAFKRIGLDWQKENWGTKWNAYHCVPIMWDGSTAILQFQTAWRPPYPWLAAIFNQTLLPFQHAWLSEGTDRGVIGSFHVRTKDSPIFFQEWEERPANDTEQRHLHKLLWGVEEFADDD